MSGPACGSDHRSLLGHRGSDGDASSPGAAGTACCSPAALTGSRRSPDEIGGEWEACDVRDRAQVDAVAARVLERHPAIAPARQQRGRPGARQRSSRRRPETIERVLETNYLGGVWCARAFLPGLRGAAAGGGAHVVNVVSVAGTIAFAPAGPYAALEARAARVLALARGARCVPRGSRCTRSCRASSRPRASRQRTNAPKRAHAPVRARLGRRRAGDREGGREGDAGR